MKCHSALMTLAVIGAAAFPSVCIGQEPQAATQ